MPRSLESLLILDEEGIGTLAYAIANGNGTLLALTFDTPRVVRHDAIAEAFVIWPEFAHDA